MPLMCASFDMYLWPTSLCILKKKLVILFHSLGKEFASPAQTQCQDETKAQICLPWKPLPFRFMLYNTQSTNPEHRWIDCSFSHRTFLYQIRRNSF